MRKVKSIKLHGYGIPTNILQLGIFRSLVDLPCFTKLSNSNNYCRESLVKFIDIHLGNYCQLLLESNV